MVKKTKKLDIEDIPLPPEADFDDDLEIYDNDEPEVQSEPEPSKNKAKPEPMPIAELDFIDGIPGKNVPLKYGFIKNDAPVQSIFVKRLSIGEVGDLIDKYQTVNVPKWELYGLMTGLSAAELRGLIDEDGDNVTEAAYDFLPRIFRPEAATKQT